MSEIRRKVIQVKGSRGRLLFKLECGHIRVMPTVTTRLKMLRCRDCEDREVNNEH